MLQRVTKRVTTVLQSVTTCYKALQSVDYKALITKHYKALQSVDYKALHKSITKALQITFHPRMLQYRLLLSW